MKVRVFRRRRGIPRVTKARVGDLTTPRLISIVRPRWIPAP